MKFSNRVLAISLMVLVLSFSSFYSFAGTPVGGNAQAPSPAGAAKFPVILGDYTNRGMRTKTGRTDIPNLLITLKKIGVRDYMHLVWKDQDAWNDFKAMAPAFQKANIRLWLYLTPPTEGASEPFGDDYIRWAIECARLAKEYPVIKGIVIDDFDQNLSKFTPDYCRRIKNEAHLIAPELSLLVVHYYRFKSAINEHVKAGVIDGVIFPYFSKPLNHRNTSQLAGQIKDLRNVLDNAQKAGGITKHLPLIIMIYATKLSNAPDSPSPEYVRDCLAIVRTATQQGLAEGAVIYALSKDNPDFLLAVSTIYNSWP